MHLPHEEHENRNDHQNWEASHQQLRPDALLLRLPAFDHHIVVDQVTDQAVVLNRGANRLERLAVTALAGNDETVDGHALDLTFFHLLDEIRIVERLRLCRAGKVVHHRHQDSGNDQPQNQVLCHVVQFTTL